MTDEGRWTRDDKNHPSSIVHRLSPLVIILLGLLIYSNTLHSPFQFDDKDFIVNNPSIRDLGDINVIWHSKGTPARGLSFLTFALNYHFHRLDVFGYHLVNLIIHLINAFLVWWFVALTLGSPRIVRAQRAVPLLAALIFLTHPVQTEAVTYISQRFTSLVTMFYLLAMCLYITARRNVGPMRSVAPIYALSALCAIAAMLSKQIALTLPVMILIYEFYFHRRTGACPQAPCEGQGLRRAAQRAAPTTILATVVFFILVLFIPFLYKFDFARILSIDVMSRSHEGDYLYWLPYLLTQFRVVAHYVKLLFFPAGLNFDYDFPASYGLFQGTTFICFLFLAGLFIVAVKLFRSHRLISFGIIWFFVTLSVESTIITIPHVIFEHRLYLPMVGFAMGIGVLLSPEGRGTKDEGRKNVHRLSSIVLRKNAAIAIVIVYALLTYQRNSVWRDGITLWSDVIQKSPHKSRPYHNRGFHYLEKGEFDKALADFNRTIELSPAYVQAYSNRATAYRALRKPGLALADYNKALELRPDNAQALHNRGLLLASLGRYDQALADYAKTLEIAPNYFLAYYNRGLLYNQLGRYDEAIADLSKAIELHSDFANSYLERGKGYYHKKMNAQAQADLKKAKELDPKLFK
ncbi:MAG TPA: tetratricopeptide repeat protein [Candidatus Omnitrophota bacterium]|nr:tetratricopeptide repeat protein [Candidatus Omnitrophota bacterium]